MKVPWAFLCASPDWSWEIDELCEVHKDLGIHFKCSGKYAQIRVCSLGNGLKLFFLNSILWLGLKALRLNTTWRNIPRIIQLMNSPYVIKATYVMDFGTEACINCSHWLSSLQLTIWGSYIFSSKSHQMLMRWVPTLRCWSLEEVMRQPQWWGPGSSSQGWACNLDVCDCSLFIGWGSSHPNSAFENLVGVCLWIWEPHFQLSDVKLLV